ncbi:MAG: hypothetical protein IKE14_07655 [Loktanella sp.]|nr:hypothetical protein [Loktanella sp.]
MHQSIEKEQETKSSPNSVTVMFHGSKVLFGAGNVFRARGNAAPSLSDILTGYLFIPAATVSLPASLKDSAPLRRLRVRIRRRSSQNTENSSAEVPDARSALAVFAANPNTRSLKAATTVITKMTEQRRCAVA